MSLYITPTEALLQVAKQHPLLAAVNSGGDRWSYAALWARIRQIADKIHDLDDTRNPIGLHMGLEIDYIAAAHAIWLSGRTVVFLSSKWMPDVLRIVLERANVRLVLFGFLEPPAMSGVRAVSTFSLAESRQPPSDSAPPSPLELVEAVPLICSITPTSGSTGVPKSIVYPMCRSLEMLSEESSTLLQPMDGQWLRGGTTFLRPLFEIRRFMFNSTTLYLDSSTSVADQCVSLYKELESDQNSQILRVHFTPSVFRAFVDFSRMRVGGFVSRLPKGFDRIYWMVIGGESLSVRDLELARVVFPAATIACNYACSEIGFAGISQMFIRPTDAIPSMISFGATQGCTALVLLDDSSSVIPMTEAGATGIVAFVTRHSATHYLANEEASQHMFRPGNNGTDILLYTDDIGCLQADGTIAIRGRSSRNVKVNGLFVDLDYVERALAPALSDADAGGDGSPLGVRGYKLVKSNATDKIVLFVCTDATDAMSVLRHARDRLRKSCKCDELAMMISSVRCIPDMPFNASYKIDLVQLQKMADSTECDLAPGFATTAEHCPDSYSATRMDDLAKEISTEIAKLSKASEAAPTDTPLLYSGLNSITVVRLYMWLQCEYEYAEEMVHLFNEEVTPRVLAAEILGEEVTEGEDEEEEEALVEEIAAEITRLSKSAEPVPKDMPLLYSGLNSITVVRLYMWLQSEHEYEEEMAHLFEDRVTARVLAMEILGHAGDDDDDDDDEEAQVQDDCDTESNSDTLVADDDSEVRMLEKDPDFATQDSVASMEPVPELYIDVSNEGVPGLGVEAGDSDDDDDEVHHSPIEEAAYQTLIVNANDSDSDREDESQENGDGAGVEISYRRLQSPSSFDRFPKSPASLERSPFASVTSSWIMPVQSEATSRSSLDSDLFPLDV